MKLDTIEKANEFIKSKGTLEFIFVTENVVTFKTPIPVIIDGILTDFEFLFFVEEGSTYYRMDSFDNFLSKLDLFEIQKVVEEDMFMEVLFHRKYKSDIIEHSSEFSIIEGLGDEFEYKVLEANLETSKQMLTFLIGNEEFEGAVKMREQIKDIEEKLKQTKTGI